MMSDEIERKKEREAKERKGKTMGVGEYTIFYDSNMRHLFVFSSSLTSVNIKYKFYILSSFFPNVYFDTLTGS